MSGFLASVLARSQRPSTEVSPDLLPRFAAAPAAQIPPPADLSAPAAPHADAPHEANPRPVVRADRTHSALLDRLEAMEQAIGRRPTRPLLAAERSGTPDFGRPAPAPFPAPAEAIHPAAEARGEAPAELGRPHEALPIRPAIPVLTPRPRPAAPLPEPPEPRPAAELETIRPLVTGVEAAHHPRPPAHAPAHREAPAPVVHITIGRLEVRASAPRPSARPGGPARSSALSLAEYLRRPLGGGAS